MKRHDLLTGLVIGAVIGVLYTAELAVHMPILVILGVFLGLKVVSTK